MSSTGETPRRRRLTAEEQALVEGHLWLAHKLASEYRWLGPSVLEGDLLGPARDGLIQAAPLYDPDRGHKFSTYAYRFVVGAMLEASRKKSPKLAQAGLAALEALEESPDDGAPEDRAETLDVAGAAMCISAGTLAFARRTGLLSDRDQRAAAILDETMSGFADVERAIVIHHYGEGQTWEAIAAELRMSTRTVRRRGTKLRAVLEERLIAAGLALPPRQASVVSP